MPDKDWYDSYVPRYWRAAARGIENGDSPQRAGDRALGALTKILRESGGLPGLQEMVGVVQAHATGLPIPAAFRTLADIRLQAGGTQLAQVAERAAQAAIAARELGRGDPDVLCELAWQFTRSALDGFLFGPAEPRHVGARFHSDKEYQAWKVQCLDEARGRGERIFRSLLDDPTARRLRAPARTVKREKTAALMRQPVN